MNVGKFRKKPVVVEAVRFEDQSHLDAIVTWINQGDTLWARGFHNYVNIYVRTLEGEMRANVGDWIIRGIKNEFYPCKPDIFDATYEEVTNG